MKKDIDFDMKLKNLYFWLYQHWCNVQSGFPEKYDSLIITEWMLMNSLICVILQYASSMLVIEEAPTGHGSDSSSPKKCFFRSPLKLPLHLLSSL